MNSESYEEILKDRILNSQINLWNGLMIFSGIVMAFLVGQKGRDLFSTVLIIFYFAMAAMCISLIFRVRTVYSYIQKMYTATPEEKEKHLRQCESHKDRIDKIEKGLRKIAFIAITLTFIYIINNNLIWLDLAGCVLRFIRNSVNFYG